MSLETRGKIPIGSLMGFHSRSPQQVSRNECQAIAISALHKTSFGNQQDVNQPEIFEIVNKLVLGYAHPLTVFYFLSCSFLLINRLSMLHG